MVRVFTLPIIRLQHIIGDEVNLLTMATHRKIATFNSTVESWTSYCERLHCYFDANDIVDPGKKRSILLTVCGPSTYQLLKNLVQPRTPMDNTYDEIVETLKTHFNPKPSPIIQRFKFNTRDRRAGESLANYVAELRALGEYCDFGTTIEDMIRDRLVCGINDHGIQRRLLQESNLTYQSAYDIAQAMETASKNIQDLCKTVPAVQRVQALEGSPCTCHRCGGNHQSNICRFRFVNCRACGKKGHIAKVCRSSRPKLDSRKPLKHPQSQRKGQGQTRPTMHSVVKDSPPPDSQALVVVTEPTPDTYNLFTVTNGAKPLMVKVQVNKQEIPMEIDTGASLSIVSEETLNIFSSGLDLKPTDVSLRMYTGEPLPVIGMLDVEVTYGPQQATLPLIVVQGKGPSLFGRNWMEVIRLNWSNINHVTTNRSLDRILSKYPVVLKNELGLLKGTKAKMFVDVDATPRFFKPRSVYLKEKVEQELARLQDDGMISPVRFSDWAAPIVPVVINDGTIRICGDYKVTADLVAKQDSYPLPRVEDLFAKVSGGRIFSKLDLRHAYLQIELDEESKKFTTINIHKGLFQCNRLPFGIASAPSIFQRAMDSLVQGLPRVSAYLDDILVSGVDEEDHLNNLDKVLQRLESAGLTLKKSKCVFGLDSIEYLGHIIDKNGLHPSPEKVKAIAEAPTPTNVTELKSFLGLINYYNKFLSNLSMLLSPLYRLLKKVPDGIGRMIKRRHSNKLNKYYSHHHCWSILILLKT